jgi:hypothetical protein
LDWKGLKTTRLNASKAQLTFAWSSCDCDKQDTSSKLRVFHCEPTAGIFVIQEHETEVRSVKQPIDTLCFYSRISHI